jgi:hypothetical protein
MTSEDPNTGEPPVLGTPDPKEVAEQAQVVEERKAAAKALKDKKVAPPPDDGYRTFVAPVEKNTRFLAKAGEMVFFRDPNSPIGKREVAREGDVWVVFTNGIVTTKDPIVIAWCEANPDICRDANDPRAKNWADLKERQVPTASREALLDRGMDVDELLYGDSAKA